MKTILTLCLTLLCVQISWATHLLGGYIQARPAAGSALQQTITAVLYLDEINGKPAADQASSIQVCFGDGSTGIAYRASRLFINDKSTSINSYTIVHTYAGASTYTLTVLLSSRTGVKNITNADRQLLALETTISTNTPAVNQTPTPGFPQNGFRVSAGRKATLLLTATDANGDSLVYGLARPLTGKSQDECNRQSIPSYRFPNDLTQKGTFKINYRTGELVWDAPVDPGYYSLAMTIGEYRAGVLISQTLQELTLLVEDATGTPGTIPPYEAAIESPSTGLVTASEEKEDVNFHLITFPNPVDDRLQIVLQTSNPTTATLQLSDGNGHKLHELSFPRMARQHEQVISMSSLAPGIYFIRAVAGERTLVRKIVKR
ncbi:T9SS type A sorting domain-containing protein [Spirosoma lituiforme]